MSKRITLISLSEKKELKKIENLINVIEEKTCKVPYGIDDEKRKEIDNLPYHFTIFATKKQNQEKLLAIAKTINRTEIQLKVDDIKISEASQDSYCLYLSIEENQAIKEIQRIFYKEFLEKKYDPDNFIFHMTLQIDKDYEKILTLKNTLKKNFKPFSLTFSRLALFDYPGEIIEIINFNKKGKKVWKS